jgi:hypothetical protein
MFLMKSEKDLGGWWWWELAVLLLPSLFGVGVVLFGLPQVKEFCLVSVRISDWCRAPKLAQLASHFNFTLCGYAHQK